jgi:hypothetical protein
MPNDSLDRRNRITEMLCATTEVMGTELSAAALSLFVEDLAALPIEVIAQALGRCRREIHGKNGFPPTMTIADVLDRAGISTPEQEVSAAADLAWAKVIACFYDCGDCPEQHLSHIKRDKVMASGDVRLVHAVRVCGGWRRITETRPREYSFLKRDFTQAYASYEVAQQVELQSLPEGDVKRLSNLAKWPE